MTDAIRPSPEVLAVARRWLAAWRDQKSETLLNLFSDSEHLRYVGTDQDEIWRGDVIRRGFRDHADELPVWRLDEDVAEAFECGDLGWALLTARVEIDGVPAPLALRYTFICALEKGSWKLIHAHSSIPASNLETHGIEHKAINKLVEALAQGFDLDQRVGVATIVFTDVVGSSNIAEKMGDRAWTARIAAHFDHIRNIVEASGGELVKSLGDGTMSSFSDPECALEAALQIQSSAEHASPPLPVRIGAHCGDVIQTRDDFFGNVVNKAARITALAGGGEVRVSDAVRMLAASSAAFVFDEPALSTLKGYEGQVLTHRLVQAPA